MKIVAVIAEYNPLHNGHLYHLRKIRENEDEDCAILVLLSGNFTQRGEVAFFNKQTRAACALAAGADLVLELPFPFCMTSAERYAASGVSLLNRLGVLDSLSFGSESGDLSDLAETAEGLASERFSNALCAFLRLHPETGYPAAAETVYRNLWGEPAVSLNAPNNLLAIEYLKALRRSQSRIQPTTVRRIGAAHGNAELGDGVFQSATAIRHAIAEGKDIRPFVPPRVFDILNAALTVGAAPCNEEALAPAVLSSFLLNTPMPDKIIADASDGLACRLRRFSREATDIMSLTYLTETKKYTRARIRRAMWNSFFGVTSSDVEESPLYTQVLAANALGLTILHRIRENGSLPVLTKPSCVNALSPAALRQKQLADRADALLELTRPDRKPASSALKYSPFIEK